MAKPPSQYERVVPMDENIPVDVTLRLFRELLDEIGLEIIVEETPSYTAYAMRRKP